MREGREVVAGSETWDGRSSPRARGIVYGYARWRYLFEPGRFVLIDGATGSGKSRYLLIPSLDLLTYGDGSAGSEPHTVVVSDVKNELVELCGDELARRGYEVLLLDTASPLRGQRFNPLARVCRLAAAGRRHEAELAADSLAAVVVPDDGPGGASHWALSARSLLSALVLYVATAEGCPDGARHMATVDAVLCRGTEGRATTPRRP
ncbi:type IV secretory system conjugative DNA transfer family protein [Thermophilibacter sp. ZX-H3]|uniref:type IV secretory system conjugative DNA transfer family protein n=1 Tax=unclassified Thermophilibacter TaxID=2847308 RepID=UPI0040409450